MGQIGQLFGLFEQTEEVGMLDDDAGRLIVEGVGDTVEIDGAVRRGNLDQLAIQACEIGRENLPVFRMNRA